MRYNHSLLGQSAFQKTPSTILSSVQPVQIVIASGSNSNHVVINSVNINHNILIWNGWFSARASIDPNTDFPYLTLPLTSEVAATTNATSTNTRTVCATALSFTSAAYGSTQRGSISVASGTGTATITSINTSLSTAVFQGYSSSATSATNLEQVLSVLKLTNATTLTGTSQSGATNTMQYNVGPFASSLIKSVQPVNVLINTSNTTGSTTITPVNMFNCICFYGGSYLASGTSVTDVSQAFAMVWLQNSATVASSRGNSSSSVIVASSLTVVEFQNYIIKSRNAGQTSITSGNSTATATLFNAVNTAKSFVNYLGSTMSSNATAESNCFGTCVLTNSTTVTFTRGTGSFNALTISWEVIEFW